MRGISALVFLLPAIAAAGELQCFGSADDAGSARVVCFGEDVRQISADLRSARVYYADAKNTLRRTVTVLVDCAGKRAYDIDSNRLDDTSFGDLHEAVCAAKARR